MAVPPVDKDGSVSKNVRFTWQIAPVLTKAMMATPTISLAMMSLMQSLAKDENAAMNEPRAALMKKLEEVATKEWLAVLGETTKQ